MAGVTWWNFYFRLFPGAIKSPQVVEFLEHLMRHLPDKLLIIWDGLPSHRSQVLMVGMRMELPPFKAASHNHQCNSLFLCNLTPNTKRNNGEMTKACSERV